MSRRRSSMLGRALPPLGAMLSLGLVAGVMIGRAAVDDASVGTAAADGAARLRAVAPASTGPADAALSAGEVALTGQAPAAETVPVPQPPPTSAPTAAPTPPATALPTQPATALPTQPATQPRVLAAVHLHTPDDYAFLLLQPDHVTPIRWDPCHPVHFKVATNQQVPGSETGKVRAAFDEVGKALGGTSFVYDGSTDVVPDTVDDSSRAGTDIVVAFALPGAGPRRSNLLSGWEAGRGGFAAWGPTRADGTITEKPTHGSVVIDAGKWKVMSRHDRTLLYLHEFGHVVGLDHPKSGDQVMSSGAYSLPLRYQPGDLQGFARLGRQAGCLR